MTDQEFQQVVLKRLDAIEKRLESIQEKIRQEN